MKKESKNLGDTKACPQCRKVILRDGHWTGIADFKIKCPHCMTFVTITVAPKPFVTLTKVAIVLLILGALTLLVPAILNHNSIQYSAEQQN